MVVLNRELTQKFGEAGIPGSNGQATKATAAG